MKHVLIVLTFGLALGWGTSVLAQGPAWSRPNIFGGYDYSDGTSSRRNIFGGYDYYKPGGQTITSRPNIFGGYDYSKPGGSSYSSRRNIFGGYDYNVPGGRTITTRFHAFLRGQRRFEGLDELKAQLAADAAAAKAALTGVIYS